MRGSIDELRRLGARPATAIHTRRLRERGVRGLPRGPRAQTNENPSGLTARELEVLALLGGGASQRRDRAATGRLAQDRRSHASAVLRKLGARSRGEAIAAAARLGLSPAKDG